MHKVKPPLTPPHAGVAAAQRGAAAPIMRFASRTALTVFFLLLVAAGTPPTADAQAPAAACDLATLFTHLSDIQGECCTAGNECSSGYPGAEDACSEECGGMFEPFWDSEC